MLNDQAAAFVSVAARPVPARPAIRGPLAAPDRGNTDKQGRHAQVGQKTVMFSDLSGAIMAQDDTVARIVIREHPDLGDSAVEIDVLSDEARAIEKAALQVAVVDLYLPGEDEPHRVTMDAGSFDQLATDQEMTELLSTARPARRSSRTGPAGPARGDRGSYASLEQAGKPHKGRVTDAEKRLVVERFDEINERLTGQGLRPISLAEPEHVERYGLAELATERSVEPE